MNEPQTPQTSPVTAAMHRRVEERQAEGYQVAPCYHEDTGTAYVVNDPNCGKPVEVCNVADCTNEPEPPAGP